MVRKSTNGKRLVRDGKCFKRRNFRGNRYTVESSTSFVSKSAQKLKNSEEFDVSIDYTSYYVVVLFSIFTTLSTYLKCKTCNGDVEFTQSDMRGLGFKLNVNSLCGTVKLNSCWW